MVPRPCDRCGAGNLDSEYMSEDIIQPLCIEYQIADGAIAWLCFDCRKAWISEIDNSEISDQYEEASFKLEFWKVRVNKNTTEDEIEKGLVLYKEVTRLSKEISKLANRWLVTS